METRRALPKVRTRPKELPRTHDEGGTAVTDHGNGQLDGSSIQEISPRYTNGRSGPRLLRDYDTVECVELVELVIFRFASFGRLAHVRRWLQALPHVLAVR